MNSTASDFSLQELESRFEMQGFVPVLDGNGETPPDGGGGGSYGYYGSSWDNPGQGDGYVGSYQYASDDSGAMYDDGSYTDGSSGAFPSYQGQQEPPKCPNGPCPPDRSKCTLCRCR